MFQELFFQIGIPIIMATVLALALYAVRQPLIIAYILTGLLLGPSVLNVVADGEVLNALSQIGIAFLLFLVGINMNWHNIKDIGGVSFVAGIGQAVVTSLVGYVLVRWLGYGAMEALFLGVAFAFSSTIIVVKLLSDKEDLERLYGRVSVGVLIVQDLLAMLILLVLGALRDHTSLAELLTVSLVKGVVVIGALWLLSHTLLPKIVRYAARSQELLFLFGVGWCFVVAGVLHQLGFGIEIGALLAGISLSGESFRREVESKIRPLRDFFLIIFFIVLGMHLTLESVQSVLWPALLLSLFILIGNPVIVILLLRALGYHPRTGFLAGTTVAQISEFSFIVLGGGVAAGLIGPQIVPLATVVGMVTIAVSSYLITYNGEVYEKLERLLLWLAPRQTKEKERAQRDPDVILMGVRDMGETVLPVMQQLGKQLVALDFDPQVVRELEGRGVPVLYGDAGNETLLRDIRAYRAKLILSTIPDQQVNRDILRELKRRRFRGTSILTAKTRAAEKELYDLGATFVIVPSVLGGAHLAELLAERKTTQRAWKRSA